MQRHDLARLPRTEPRCLVWKATFPGCLACWDSLASRALAGRRGWTGEPEFKGAAEGGDQRREAQEGGGGGFSESHKLETERMPGHLHFLPLLIGIISLAPSFLEGNFK